MSTNPTTGFGFLNFFRTNPQSNSNGSSFIPFSISPGEDSVIPQKDDGSLLYKIHHPNPTNSFAPSKYNKYSNIVEYKKTIKEQPPFIASISNPSLPDSLKEDPSSIGQEVHRSLNWIQFKPIGFPDPNGVLPEGKTQQVQAKENLNKITKRVNVITSNENHTQQLFSYHHQGAAGDLFTACSTHFSNPELSLDITGLPGSMSRFELEKVQKNNTAYLFTASKAIAVRSMADGQPNYLSTATLTSTYEFTPGKNDQLVVTNLTHSVTKWTSLDERQKKLQKEANSLKESITTLEGMLSEYQKSDSSKELAEPLQEEITEKKLFLNRLESEISALPKN